MGRVLWTVAFLCAWTAGIRVGGQTAIPNIPAVPVDPVTGILELFKTHDVVALSEGNQATSKAMPSASR